MIDTCRVSLIRDNAARSSITQDTLGNRYIFGQSLCYLLLYKHIAAHSVRKLSREKCVHS